MERQKMRTWVEVDLKRIEDNISAMRAKLGPDTRFLGVVKADAYGHGAVQVAHVLEKQGAGYLAVACLEEALALRQNGITLPVLILGYTPPEYASALIENGVTQAVQSPETARKLSDEAGKCGGRVCVHIKLDTGMGRTGFRCGEHGELSAAAAAMRLPGLCVEGVFTHFAVSDEAAGKEFTERQIALFESSVRRLEELYGKKIAIKHCANSGAMLNYGCAYMDMVRPGIMLYGLYPCRYDGDIRVMPAMSLKARVAQVRDAYPGDTVSYGRTYSVKDRRRIAAVTVGYADGLHRALSGKIDVLIRGKRCPQVGRICMDMCMVDVTDVPDAAVGDEVTVFGTDGRETISVDELAEKAGTISYELLCAVSPRVPRVYINGGAEYNEM